MPSPYPQVARSALETLYRLAKEACDEIEKFQPDLVIGLAHSGWLPVEVTRALWAETRTAPFPPSTRTNIGQEKHEIYHARYGTDPPAFCCGECNWGDAGRLGHYLAWVTEQRTWKNTLRKQVASVLPSKPKRIMIVDDVLGGYRSGYAALALLEALYPNAEVSMCAGHNDWTDNFVTGWLAEFVPPLAQEITALGVDSSKVRHSSPWQELLKPLINGTEDITPDSLDWQFITRDSKAVKALAEYAPAEVALSAPRWAKELAIAYALQRIRGEIKDDEVIEPPDYGSRWNLTLDNEERLAARSWIRGGVTRADIAEVFGADRASMKEGLRVVKNETEWTAHNERANETYLPDVVADTWINVYPPVENYPSPKIPVFGFAEFLRGQVWAGVYPLLYNNLEHLLFKDFLCAGITSFINLTHPKDKYRKFPYRKRLLEVSCESHTHIEIEEFPLSLRDVPDEQQVTRILKYIHRVTKAGRGVYIHAGYNLDGRAPLILACLLIERGYSPKRALAKVDAFWMKTLYFLIRSPLSEEQRQFVLNWKAEK